MKLVTPLTRVLGLRVPIIQAPMAGGPSTPELVAACSAAGALGSFGFAYTAAEDMRRQAAAVRAKTDRPFAINLFAAPLPTGIGGEAQRAAIEALAPYYQEFGLNPPEPAQAPYAPSLEAQLEAVAEIRPAVFTAHLGAIKKEFLEALRKQGTRLGGSATCVEEAKALEALGVDFIIAQGGEAGGHRGTWLRDPYDALTGTLALTRLVVRAVKTPVVAAGGIMDGAGIAAALALGAQAAQLGTAFLATPESGAAPLHKQALLEAREDTTRITEKFTGKPARGLANRFMREMNERDAPRIPFPAQTLLTAGLRAASAKAGKADFLSLWAGQAAPLARALPAAELVSRLEGETLQAIQNLKGVLHES